MSSLERKLALPEEILLAVSNPARYTGGEIGSVMKQKASVRLRFAFCFPDVYEIGMSHLGIQILYDMFNKREDVWCERVYSPWPDLSDIMKEKNIPLFALESQDNVREFDFLGITLQYEMCYTNILEILSLSGIPLSSKDRTEDDPIVIGGGPCTYNPEPLYEFFDMFYIGEGEISYDRLFDLYIGMRAKGDFKREDFLREASHIEGIYVPSLYEVSYNDDGTIKSFKPMYDDVPAVVSKTVVVDFDTAPYLSQPILPFIKVTQDRAVLEVQRGCIRGCRFCQAGMIYRPNRQKNIEVLKKDADNILNNSGYEEITLSSLSTSDYQTLEELVDYLIENYSDKKVNISLPSLRIDSVFLSLMEKLSDVKKNSVTFAPEAGSQRMRDVINKGLNIEDIMGGARMVYEAGYNKIKCYFMIGLPGERPEDVEAIAVLAEDLAMLYYDTVPKEKRNGKCQITVSTSFFVPKPFTPFQWAGMQGEEYYKEMAHMLKGKIISTLNHKSIHYMYHEPDVTMIEGVLARGDRRLSSVIRAVYEAGAHFDAWTEYYDNEKWVNAFKSCGVDPDFYTKRERFLDEILPWDFIECGVSKEFLTREWRTAMGEKVTPNCRERCSACGAKKYGGGVCYESQN